MNAHKERIRKNKTCLNCGFFVEKEYCPNCGQQNTESRQSFHHLFTHFIFDFVHYDSSFWKTTKLLFLSPAKLSKEYMDGKRKSYVNPFSLYIFASFLAFLIPTILPTKDTHSSDIHIDINMEQAKDSISGLPEIDMDEYGTIHSIAELDSIHRSRPEEERVSSFEYYTYKSAFYAFKNMKDKNRLQMAIDFFIHNLPKVLFIYMPIFAFWLWLFHNKKKRYYFDSGIFTLHFFTVVLLTITIFSILANISTWLNIRQYTMPIMIFSMILYITFYFFRGNRIFYQEKRAISNFKAATLLVINTIFILITLCCYTAFVFYKIYINMS